MTDTMPLWFWLPTVIVGWSWLAVLAFRSVTADPNPSYSRLDLLDGLGSRTG